MAAGKGTRMKSSLPKVLHKICGKEMVNYVIDALEDSKIFNINVIVGYCGEQVMAAIKSKNVSYSYQKEQLGTAHAVKCALEYLKNKKGLVIILSGDCPMIKNETIKRAVNFHIKGNYDATVVSSYTENPFGYGRIVRNKNKCVEKIIEHKDCNEYEKSINEINTGTYIFDIEKLINNIDSIENNNAQGEYYLTDIIQILKNKGYKIGAVDVPYNEVLGVNTKEQLAEAENIIKNR